MACVLVFAAGLLMVTGVRAQPPSADLCAGALAPEDEVACLRKALKEATQALEQSRSGNPAAAPAAPTSARSGPAAPGATVATPSPTAAPATSPTSRPAAQAASATAPVAQPAAPTQPAVAAPAAVVRAPEAASPVVAQAREELGQEQLPGARSKQERARNEGVPAVVLAVREDRDGLLRLTLDNGQVWMQSDRPSVQVVLKNEQTYEVEIKKSGFGGYRMHFPNLNRTIVVKRVL